MGVGVEGDRGTGASYRFLCIYVVVVCDGIYFVLKNIQNIDFHYILDTFSKMAQLPWHLCHL